MPLGVGIGCKWLVGLIREWAVEGVSRHHTHTHKATNERIAPTLEGLALRLPSCSVNLFHLAPAVASLYHAQSSENVQTQL